MAAPGTIRFAELATDPATPAAGYAVVYIKTDNVFYIKDSSGTVIPLGSASSITSLVGDVTGAGPGVTTTTVQYVGGQSAANIAAAVVKVEGATASNVGGTLVVRDVSGNFAANVITASLNGNASTATAATTAIDFTGNLYGDVTGTQGATIILDTVVNAKLLTGYSVGSNTAISATDSILSAFEKVQGQLNASFSSAITELTGDVSAIGPGIASATVNSVGGSSALNIHLAEVTANQLLVTLNSGLSVNYNGGNVIFNGTETFIPSGSVSVPASTTNGYVYVDITGIVGAAPALPDNTIPLAVFNSSLTTVTFLEDARVLLSRNLVWGLAGDIQPETPQNAASAGTSERYARADHVHPTTAAAAATQTPNQSNGAGASSSFARADHIHNIPTAIPVQIGTSNSQGTSASFSNSDHIHAHGAQTDPTLHAVATDSLNGFMSASDKTKLDAATALDTPSTLVIRDPSGNFSAGTITATLNGNASTSTNFTGVLAGDVSGTQSATSVDKIKGISVDPTAPTDAQFLVYQSGITAYKPASMSADVTMNDVGATTISVGVVTDTKASLAVKPAVTVVATTNQALTGLPTIDGVATAAGSIILLTAQTTASQNGPWVAASGAWARPTWYPSGGTTQSFQFITTLVRLGTIYQGSVWRQTTAAPVIIDTTSTAWVVTPVSGNFKSSFVIGPQIGAAEVDLIFANAFQGTLAWNPTASYKITLPPTQGAGGTVPTNDGAGNLTWVNPQVNIDGGTPGAVYTSGQFISGGTP